MAEEPKLPRRDLIILPLLSLLTLVCLFALSEVLATHFYPVQIENSCDIKDPVLLSRHLPNCMSRTKLAEGPWVVNNYNECGYRSATSCGPKPQGALRIAVFGSSLSEGYMVPYEKTFASRIGADLRNRCGRAVDVQDLGNGKYRWERAKLNLVEALKLNPDVVITTVLPYDLEKSPSEGAQGEPAQRQPSLLERVFQLVKSSRTFYVAQYFYFKNADAFTSLYLKYGEKADFLRPPFSPFWAARLDAYDKLLGGMAERTRAAGVPMVLVFVPQRAQVALLTKENYPEHVDPWALGRSVGDLAAKHGIYFVNTSRDFGRIPDAADLFYPVDGHPSGDGHKVIANAIVTRLLGMGGSVFSSCNADKPAADEKGRQ